MEPIRFQVLNMFKKPLKGLQVFLKLPGSPDLIYKAETMEHPIEAWHPIMSGFQDATPYMEPVIIKPDQKYQVTVHTSPWDQSRWPSIPFEIKGRSRGITLCIRPDSYEVSIQDHKFEPLPLSAMDCLNPSVDSTLAAVGVGNENNKGKDSNEDEEMTY